MTNRPGIVIAVIVSSFALLSCQSGGVGLGDSGDVKTDDDISERKHVETKLTMSDYKAMAEEVTNKFLSSDLAKSWSDNEEKPKLVVGNLRNNTTNEDIRVQDIQDKISTTLFQSDLISIVDKETATSFDYVVKSEMTSTTQGMGKLKEYTLKLNVYSIDGEMKGQWLDSMRLSRQ